jgi:hypothetical protein
MLAKFLSTVVSSGFTVTVKPCDPLNPGCGIEFIIEGPGLRIVGIDSFPGKTASVEDAFNDAKKKFWKSRRS